MVWSVRLPRCSLIDGQQDQSCWDQGTQKGAFQDACLRLHVCPHIYSFSLLLMCFCKTNPIFPLLYIQTFLNVDFLKFLTTRIPDYGKNFRHWEVLDLWEGSFLGANHLRTINSLPPTTHSAANWGGRAPIRWNTIAFFQQITTNQRLFLCRG